MECVVVDNTGVVFLDSLLCNRHVLSTLSKKKIFISSSEQSYEVGVIIILSFLMRKPRPK